MVAKTNGVLTCGMWSWFSPIIEQTRLGRPHLIDEVDAEQMQYQTSQHEVGKCSLIADGIEVPLLVFWVRLHSERRCEDELADCGAEAGEECVERLRGE